jgi:hypothetical protein
VIADRRADARRARAPVHHRIRVRLRQRGTAQATSAARNRAAGDGALLQIF